MANSTWTAHVIDAFRCSVMANSTWTARHIDTLWGTPVRVVYPPCDTAELAALDREPGGQSGPGHAIDVISVGQVSGPVYGRTLNNELRLLAPVAGSAWEAQPACLLSVDVFVGTKPRPCWEEVIILPVASGACAGKKRPQRHVASGSAESQREARAWRVPMRPRSSARKRTTPSRLRRSRRPGGPGQVQGVVGRIRASFSLVLAEMRQTEPSCETSSPGETPWGSGQRLCALGEALGG